MSTNKNKNTGVQARSIEAIDIEKELNAINTKDNRTYKQYLGEINKYAKFIQFCDKLITDVEDFPASIFDDERIAKFILSEGIVNKI